MTLGVLWISPIIAVVLHQYGHPNPVCFYLHTYPLWAHWSIRLQGIHIAQRPSPQGRPKKCQWSGADFKNIEVRGGYPLQKLIRFHSFVNCTMVILVNFLDCFCQISFFETYNHLLPLLHSLKQHNQRKFPLKNTKQGKTINKCNQNSCTIENKVKTQVKFCKNRFILILSIRSQILQSITLYILNQCSRFF